MKFMSYILVGFLFFGALAVVGYITIMTEGGPLKKELPTVKVYFPNADGIKIGNKVTVQGVSFGYVSSVKLVQVDEFGNVLSDDAEGIGTRVELTLTLQSNLKLYENYDIKIKNESIISGRVVTIDPGTAYPIDPKSREFKSQTTPSVPIDLKNAKGRNTIKGTVTQDPLVSLSELIAENRADLRRIMSNVSEITEKVNTGRGTLGRIINQDDIHKNVNTTLTDAQIVIRELRESIEDLREQAPVTSFIRAGLSAF